MNSATN